MQTVLCQFLAGEDITTTSSSSASAMACLTKPYDAVARSGPTGRAQSLPRRVGAELRFFLAGRTPTEAKQR